MNSEFSLAVHSLTYLALLPGKMATSDYLAESASVHPVRIRKMLSLLKKNGYIKSKEGAGGGFILACEPSEVTLKEIYSITSEGTLQPKCSQANEQCIIGANMKHVLFSIFQDAEEHLGNFLGQFTIADILVQIKEKDAQNI
ncbi:MULTISPECIES: Rrf2 family transcriptional regulator [Bacillaceae]|uniref:RrF2 family transcriptional regulator n=1 Tax=Bacillaceae TaxID=186817 RepID=UPI001BDEA64E|nr:MULTISPECIES: Rrf2 family transcriptional regulator [Bacillaceae]MDX8362803.1 Rrf2 family transcriptional regulator [Cytobacillus sp. IB215316]MDX8367367.1 Rrf2 family transcriptional regulator [Cytobacillus sp. IB215665]